MLKKFNKQKLENPVSVQEYRKLYYAEHRAEMIEHQKQTIQCTICGSCVLRAHMSRHHKTIKCMRAKNITVFENFTRSTQKYDDFIVQNNEQPIVEN